MREPRSPIECLEDQVFLVFLLVCVVTLGSAIFIDRMERRVEALEAREGE